MNQEDIRSAVLTSVINFLTDNRVNVIPESRLLEDLGLDSTEMVDILVDIEKKLKISLKDVKFAQLNTINSLVCEVAARMPEAVT